MALHGIGPLAGRPPAAELGDLPTAGASGAAAGGSFVDALGQAVANVERLQASADASAEQVALGGGNLHETALALEKADIAIRVATKVRNKLVEAYQDIMRMQV